MKGKDIVKGVECCKDDAIFCVDCPYYDENGEHEQLCVYRLHKDFLDFINRLKAERNKYKIKAQNQKGHLAKLYKLTAGQLADLESLSMDLSSAIMEKDALLDMVEEQKAELAKKDTEIDILIRKKEALRDENSELKAEVERLRNTVKTDFLTVRKKLKLSQSDIVEIRAEAIKEFWNKLKTHSRKMRGIDVDREFWDRAILVEDGDYLVKEMTGGGAK